MTREIDYSFFHLGGLQDAVLRTLEKACLTVGAKRGRDVLCCALTSELETPEAFRAEMSDEFGLLLSEETLKFLRAAVEADWHIREARRLLEEACHG